MHKDKVIEFFKNIQLDEFELRVEETKYLGFDYSNNQKKCSIGVMNISTRESKGFSCYVQFFKYELLNREIRNRNDKNFSPPSVRPYTQANVIDHEFGNGIMDSFPVQVKTQFQLEKVRKLLLTYYMQDARPFFNYWNDIRAFLPFIEQDTREAILLLGNNYNLKKMVIWKLCSHPRYEEFVDKKISLLKKTIIENPQNENYIRVINEIETKYNELQSIAPDYEWHESYLLKKPFLPIKNS